MSGVKRLEPAVFRLPVEGIRSGYYSDAYFNHAKVLLEAQSRHPHVLMQVFQKRDPAVLGGIDEAIAVLRECSGRARADGSWESGWESLDVRALHEGDEIEAHEVVLTIEGDYTLFAQLETVYLGCLARRTRIMTNVRRTVAAARATLTGRLRPACMSWPFTSSASSAAWCHWSALTLAAASPVMPH